jgi:hypothetical protein
MHKLLIALVALFLASTPTWAQDTRTARVDRIARALGIEQLLAETQAASLAATKGQVSELMSSLKESGIPDDYLYEMRSKIEQMYAKALGAWDPKEASRIYAEGLLDVLSDEELAEAEHYVQSPEGKKIYRAIADSEANMVNYVQSKTNAVVQAEMGKFIEDMKTAARRSKQATKP